MLVRDYTTIIDDLIKLLAETRNENSHLRELLGESLEPVELGVRFTRFDSSIAKANSVYP